MAILIKFLLVISLPFLIGSGCNNKKETGTTPLDFSKMIQPVPEYSVLKHDDYWVWGASMVRSDDGICHLFYSRWHKNYKLNDWLFKSEIAYATSENPGGPYHFKKVALKGRGENFWDKDMAHNPHIKKFGNKYYLYFISHNVKDQGQEKRMAYRSAQRIGVAVAEDPAGPWEICDKPLIDLQEGKPAHGYAVNPSVCQKPDGSYLMIFKSLPENWRESEKFISIQCIATSDTPVGPFTIYEKPVLTEFTAEDPFLWYQDERYYAILDDQYGDYLGERGMTLFESSNGYDWKPSKNPLVSKLKIVWKNGSIMPLNHLERPQLWFDENGEPAMLFCAAASTVKNDAGVEELKSYNIHIPLKQ
jgi:hypothetical protein